MNRLPGNFRIAVIRLYQLAQKADPSIAYIVRISGEAGPHRAFLALLACMSLFLLLMSGVAESQNPDCENVEFSDEILSRFPQAPGSCLDVISRDGEEFAVFKVQLDRVTGNTLHVRFRHPDGSRGPAARIATQPDFRVLVDGQPTRVRNLAVNQELTAYVQVSRPMIALAPAEQTQTLHVVPLFTSASGEGAEERSMSDGEGELAALSDGPSMPDTASPAPLSATVGLLLIIGAIGSRAIRGVRAA